MQNVRLWKKVRFWPKKRVFNCLRWLSTLRGGHLPKAYTAHAEEPYLCRVTWVPPPTNMQQLRARGPACVYFNRECGLFGPIFGPIWPDFGQFLAPVEVYYHRKQLNTLFSGTG